MNTSMRGIPDLKQKQSHEKRHVDIEDETARRDGSEAGVKTTNKGTSSDKGSITQAAQNSHSISRFLQAIRDIVRRVFALALYLTGVNLATDHNGEFHRAPLIGQKKPAQPLYTALHQGEIRVLCMNNDDSKSIVGILKVVRLDDRHRFIGKLTNFQYGYEALSYVWGDETEKTIITIDGHKVDIHVSLYDALMVLREKRPGVSLWADALRINQADDPEKLHQIALMGKIYGAACKV
jgi:hypothetical protein